MRKIKMDSHMDRKQAWIIVMDEDLMKDRGIVMTPGLLPH